MLLYICFQCPLISQLSYKHWTDWIVMHKARNMHCIVSLEKISWKFHQMTLIWILIGTTTFFIPYHFYGLSISTFILVVFCIIIGLYFFVVADIKSVPRMHQVRQWPHSHLSLPVVLPPVCVIWHKVTVDDYMYINCTDKMWRNGYCKRDPQTVSGTCR